MLKKKLINLLRSRFSKQSLVVLFPYLIKVYVNRLLSVSVVLIRMSPHVGYRRGNGFQSCSFNCKMNTGLFCRYFDCLLKRTCNWITFLKFLSYPSSPLPSYRPCLLDCRRLFFSVHCLLSPSFKLHLP
jgi:hypothetical protein